ncbi:MAG: ATP-binding protein [Verrucomicrobia bacterium]|nr:ATP-binding protein [Verrucomicrobiota bacterium]MCH8514119.1 ATP-binding protein [Kiritimatiellia bacterium]
MPKKEYITETGLRLRSLSITNYKKLNKLEIEFPLPRMERDLDILVLGSKNGGGKTSVLECCSLLFLAGAIGKMRFERLREAEPIGDVASLLVKAGHENATISGVFEKGAETINVSIKISRTGFGSPSVTGSEKLAKLLKEDRRELFDGRLEFALSSVLAFSGEPLVLPPLLHFNSYRKVQESNPELGMMAEDYPVHRIMRFAGRPGVRSFSSPISAFKLEILRSLMGQASLFEGFDESVSKEILDQLNGLIQRYCGGKIENLRALPDNKIDIRIQPNNGDKSFSFDGLSSGQKEMISTLFLIWRNSKDQPCVVLIDEPELHLNAEWHGDFVVQLRKLAPRNQYILATHSEEIFRSVDDSRRALLAVENETAGDS